MTLDTSKPWEGAIVLCVISCIFCVCAHRVGTMCVGRPWWCGSFPGLRKASLTQAAVASVTCTHTVHPGAAPFLPAALEVELPGA